MEILEMWQKTGGEDLLKALEKEREQKRLTEEPKSAIIDPYSGYDVGGTRSRNTMISYQMLRNMARVAPIAAIIRTRQDQVARYAKRPKFDGDIGFEIVLKDREKKMTDAQRKRAHEIEDFFLCTGYARNRRRKDNFDMFLRKIVRDSLVLDAMTFEITPNIKGEIAELWAVDAATIELVVNSPLGEGQDNIVYEPLTRGGLKLGSDNIAYVQRVNGEIRAEFSEDELAYAVRNPRTDIEYADFGMSELEVLIEIVTGIVNGIRYNTAYFTENKLPQGVLEIVGKVKDEHMESFSRHWKQMTSGAAGKWAVPVIGMSEGQGIKWTPFKQSNQDMQFNEFLEFLFNIACAVYSTDPNEVGFKSWSSNSGSMGQSDNTKEKINHSKDKGLVPLLAFLENTFNHEVVDLIDPEFEFNWVGVDEQDEDNKLDRMTKQSGMGLVTVADLRKQEDMDELINPETGKPWMWTYAPANPQLIQVFMAEAGLGQQQGAPGEDPEGGDPNDPNAEAEQAKADDQHGKQQEMADDGHEKKLEIMDKQHEQNMEAKEADQAHQIKMAKMAADNQAKAEKAKPKDDKEKTELKKSLPTSEPREIVIEWDDY